jgi:hypothetical protein
MTINNSDKLYELLMGEEVNVRLACEMQQLFTTKEWTSALRKIYKVVSKKGHPVFIHTGRGLPKIGFHDTESNWYVTNMFVKTGLYYVHHKVYPVHDLKSYVSRSQIKDISDKIISILNR